MSGGKSLLYFCLLLASIVCITAGRDGETGPEKLRSLQKRVLDGLITFNSQSYSDFVVAPERPYHLFLLFTAMGDKYKCEVCQQVGPEYTVLAESATDSQKKARDGYDVFFGVVDYDSNQASFAIHEFTSAPQLVYVSSDRSNDEGDKLPVKIPITSGNMYSIYQLGKTAEGMSSFVREKTGLEFEVKRSKVFAYTVAGCVLTVFLLIVRAVLYNFDAVLARLRRKKLWITISFLFYGLSVSGMVYCIIREPPAFSQERNGKMKLFHPAGRQQFVFEGLVVGAYDVFAAISIILLSQWAVYIKNQFARYIAMSLCVFGFGFMYKSMISAYAFKNQWYESWF